MFVAKSMPTVWASLRNGDLNAAWREAATFLATGREKERTSQRTTAQDKENQTTP